MRSKQQNGDLRLASSFVVWLMRCARFFDAQAGFRAILRFLRFSLSSLLGFAIDNIVFTLVLLGLQAQGFLRRYDILISLVVARVISSTVNYLFNRFFVFDSRGSVATSFIRYWLLVLLIAALSYAGTAGLSFAFDAQGTVITCIKIVVETFLFVLSYKLQKVWVFAGRGSAP